MCASEIQISFLSLLRLDCDVMTLAGDGVRLRDHDITQCDLKLGFPVRNLAVAGGTLLVTGGENNID